jgi:hypothetical protein
MLKLISLDFLFPSRQMQRVFFVCVLERWMREEKERRKRGEREEKERNVSAWEMEG